MQGNSIHASLPTATPNRLPSTTDSTDSTPSTTSDDQPGKPLPGRDGANVDETQLERKRIAQALGELFDRIDKLDMKARGELSGRLADVGLCAVGLAEGIFKNDLENAVGYLELLRDTYHKAIQRQPSGAQPAANQGPGLADLHRTTPPNTGSFICVFWRDTAEAARADVDEIRGLRLSEWLARTCARCLRNVPPTIDKDDPICPICRRHLTDQARAEFDAPSIRAIVEYGRDLARGFEADICNDDLTAFAEGLPIRPMPDLENQVMRVELAARNAEVHAGHIEDAVASGNLDDVALRIRWLSIERENLAAEFARLAGMFGFTPQKIEYVPTK